MRRAHERERPMGMAWYRSDAPGIGGRLRNRPADFRVTELEDAPIEPIESSSDAYPNLVLRATLTAWDTNEFARRLSNKLGISRERVSWAGTKDKHGITTQLISVSDVEPDASPAIDRAEIEVVGRAGRALRFGDLLGNEFVIRVRDATDPTHIDDTLADLAWADAPQGAVGVPNYFGHQRFGSRRPITHTVGLAICRRDWRGAVLSYLGSPHEAEPDRTRQARARIDAGEDWSTALSAFPEYLRYERAMLHSLVESGETDGPDDGDQAGEPYRTALAALPENLRRLFVHAAQSWLFNRIISERMAAGLPLDRAVPGDRVCFVETDASAPVPIPDVDRIQRATDGRLVAINRHCRRGRAFVTAPLVGTDTTFADGQPGEIERSVLAAAGIDRSDFDLPDPYGSAGTRRAIVVRTTVGIDREPPVFEFALPKGSYATVVMREFLKTDPTAM